MKKYLLLLVIIAINVFHCEARVTLKGGDTSIFEQKNSMNLEIRDSVPMLVKQKMPADKFFMARGLASYKKFLADMEVGHKYFENEVNKSNLIELNKANAKYTLRLTIDRLYIGNTSKATKFYGVADIIDKSTGLIVCSFIVDKTKGGKSWIFSGRAARTYEQVAKELVEAVKKLKKYTGN